MLLVACLLFTAEPAPMPPPPPSPDRVDAACHDGVGRVVPCPAASAPPPLEPLAQEGDDGCKEDGTPAADGPNIAAITGIVGSATAVAGALTAVVVGLAQVPAPWDYWKYAGELQKAQIEFRKKPDAAFLKDAERARSGMHGIENALGDQVGVWVASGVTLATSGVGLASSIVIVAGE